MEKTNLSTTVFTKIIRAYQIVISPFFGHCCRFYPSCSSFAIEAIQTHGTIRGCYLSIKRLLCCHPWHPGGIDLVPEKKSHVS